MKKPIITAFRQLIVPAILLIAGSVLPCGITAQPIAGGDGHSLYLCSDSTAMSCGDNVNGQLGDGTTTQSITSVQVNGLTGITAIAGGWYHSLFLKNDSTVWVCGNNGNGQLGDGSTVDKSTPVQVTGLCIVVIPCIPPTLTISFTNVSCNGGNNGTATISASGGTAPYTYMWSDNQVTAVATGLSSGTYYVTVTDSTGCSATDSAVIISPPAMVITVSTTDATCGNNNGIATIDSIQNGTPPYTYLWSNGSTDSTATGLSSGTYYVTVTDSTGCSATDSGQITATPSVASILDATTTDSSICPGAIAQLDAQLGAIIPPFCGPSTSGCVGAPTTIVSGTGTLSNSNTSYPAPFGNWYWGSRHQFLFTAAELNALGFTGGQITSIAWNVDSIAGTSTYNNFEIRMTCSNLTCLSTWVTGMTTVFPAQTITATLGWNTFNYTTPFDWDGVSSIVVEVCSNNSSYTSNCHTYYTATSCNRSLYYRSDISTVCYNGTPSASLNRPNATFGICNASITPANYTYSWSPTTGLNNPNIQNPTASPSQTTTYIVTVTDIASGCTGVDSVNLYVANLSAPAMTVVDESCYGQCDETVTATMSAGTSPYSYLWSNGQTAQTASGLCDGIYSVTVTDSSGCSATDSVVIISPPAMVITLSTTEATCGNNNGSATVDSIQNGTPPYSYQWNNGDTTATTDSLLAGMYMVTVTDSLGCSNFAIATVNDLDGPALSVLSTTASNCFGSYDGSIDISVSGGQTPYTYLWSNGQTTEDATGLPAGTHEVSVTDANGCVAVQSINVNGPAAPLSISDSTVSASCGNSDGSATALPSGGTSPYAFIWSGGGSQQTETGLAAGVYMVTVTDSNGCQDSAFVAVSNTGSLAITTDSIINGSCSGGGAIYISVNGGTSPYIYLWSNAATTEDLIGLPAGTYNITVTDSTGCAATASYTLQSTFLNNEQLCLVTVDTATGTNLIVWEKSVGQGIASYNIYRESSTANVYYLAGNVPYDSLSIYLDTVSNPMIHSWRYKLTALDSCGSESPMSTVHKTIHLVLSHFGNDNYLIWDPYEGFTYPKFYIWRQDGAYQWSLIDSIASNLFSYTDPLPPSGTRTYFVEVKSPSTCFAARSLNYNSSRSNRSENLSNTGVTPAVNNGNWILYPNPTTGLLTIRSPFALDPTEFYVYDLMGREVEVPEIQKSGSGTRFDMSHLSNGVYFLKAGLSVRKVILKH